MAVTAVAPSLAQFGLSTADAAEREEPVLPRPAAIALPRSEAWLTPRPPLPLDAAFQRPQRVTTRLSEDVEQETLRDGGAQLVAYGQYDPERPPVVLVHGANGSGAEMTALADRLTAAGRQVYVFQYDDFHQSNTESGARLASELQRLWQLTPHRNAPLEIVGYCMGGIISRVALNHLAQNGAPRVGFPSVRMQGLDMPLDGAAHEPRFMRHIVDWFMRFVGYPAFADMRGSSAMYAGLFAADLPGVSFTNLAATRRDGGNRFFSRNLHDLSDDDRAAIAGYLTGGQEPDDLRARNYARGLARDDNGENLRRRLAAEIARGLSPSDALAIAYDATMPTVDANHYTIAADASTIERVLRTLHAPPEGVAVNAAPR